MKLQGFKNKTYYIFLLSFLFLSHCSIDKNNLAGKYKTKNTDFNILERFRIMFLKEYRVINEKLTLKEDSSYIYQKCSAIEKGVWKISNDTLILHLKKVKLKTKSKAYQKREDSVLKFNIEKNKLILKKKYDSFSTKIILYKMKFF